MYLVVSQWEVIPGHEGQFEEIGRKVRAVLLDQKGIELLQTFKNDAGHVIVVHGYTDKAAYENVVNNPRSAFVKALEETRLEDHSRWIGSERGETFE